MKPYFEYNGKRYEFEAGFRLQKEFKTEYNKKLNSTRSDLINDSDLEEISKVKEELDKLKLEAETKNLTEEEINNKTSKIMFKYPNVMKVLSKQSENNDNDEINEKYCRLMFETKYPNEKEVFDEFCDSVCYDQGINYLYSLFSSVINEVFTSVVQEQPLQNVLYDWQKKGNQSN